MYEVKQNDFDLWYAALMETIRNEQEMQGLSNVALANLAGLSVSCVREAVSWIKRPNIESLYRIMAALEIDFERVTKDYAEEQK